MHVSLRCLSRLAFGARAVILLTATLATAEWGRGQDVLDGIAAVVNNDVITFSQLRELTAPAEQNARTNLSGAMLTERIKEIRLKALEELIDRQLVIQEFRKLEEKGASIPTHFVDEQINKIIRDDFGNDRTTFLKTLAAQGYTLERFRKLEEEKIVVQAMRQRELKADIFIPETRIASYYKENMQFWTENDELRLRMIVIRKGENPEEKRPLMMEIRRKLERGADFAGLARLYSEDSNREKGGDWGWIDRKTLNPILTRAAFTAPNGKVSDIVEIADSFYLLKAEGRRGGTVKPLAAVRDQIQRFLTEQERQKQQQAWTKRLREKAFVKIY